MKIKEFVSSERPRERALKNGVESLSNSDLLAIIIRNGQHGRNAIELANDVIKLAGNSLMSLLWMSPKELMSIGGIGKEKAITILSALEIGRRMLVESDSSLSSPRVTGPEDIYRIFDPILRFKQSEECYILLLDLAGKSLSYHQISAGGFSSTAVDVRKVCAIAVKEKAAGVVLVHNHPTGNSSPSPEDCSLTTRIREALGLLDISLLDHVVCGRAEYYSFAEEKIFKVPRCS